MRDRNWSDVEATAKRPKALAVRHIFGRPTPLPVLILHRPGRANTRRRLDGILASFWLRREFEIDAFFAMALECLNGNDYQAKPTDRGDKLLNDSMHAVTRCHRTAGLRPGSAVVDCQRYGQNLSVSLSTLRQ